MWQDSFAHFGIAQKSLQMPCYWGLNSRRYGMRKSQIQSKPKEADLLKSYQERGR